MNHQSTQLLSRHFSPNSSILSLVHNQTFVSSFLFYSAFQYYFLQTLRKQYPTVFYNNSKPMAWILSWMISSLVLPCSFYFTYNLHNMDWTYASNNLVLNNMPDWTFNNLVLNNMDWTSNNFAYVMHLYSFLLWSWIYSWVSSITPKESTLCLDTFIICCTLTSFLISLHAIFLEYWDYYVCLNFLPLSCL